MEESRLTTRVLGLICFTFLVVACYGGALFGGGQFAFRDAAHFYYPLYYRVQQEWAAGHLPLWEPRENSGMPLLGSPMAAVLYPGKIFFAILPYAWGLRSYIVAHEFLAFGAMLALTRSWGVSWTGGLLAGLCFAFGGPILSNDFNVIYLVAQRGPPSVSEQLIAGSGWDDDQPCPNWPWFSRCRFWEVTLRPRMSPLSVPLGTQLACPGIGKRHLGIPGPGAWELSLFSSAGPGWGQLWLHAFMAGEREWDR